MADESRLFEDVQGAEWLVHQEVARATAPLVHQLDQERARADALECELDGAARFEARVRRHLQDL